MSILRGMLCPIPADRISPSKLVSKIESAISKMNNDNSVSDRSIRIYKKEEEIQSPPQSSYTLSSGSFSSDRQIPFKKGDFQQSFSKIDFKENALKLVSQIVSDSKKAVVVEEPQRTRKRLYSNTIDYLSQTQSSPYLSHPGCELLTPEKRIVLSDNRAAHSLKRNATTIKTNDFGSYFNNEFKVTTGESQAPRIRFNSVRCIQNETIFNRIDESKNKSSRIILDGNTKLASDGIAVSIVRTQTPFGFDKNGVAKRLIKAPFEYYC